MDSKRKITVVDLNAGLGGRALAFEKEGFNVLAISETDNDSIDFCREILENPFVISKNIEDIKHTDIPKADILSISFSGLGKNLDEINKTLSEIILHTAPKAFFLQIPMMMFRNKYFQPLSTAVFRRYVYSYRALRERDYSGIAANGQQIYMIGIRADITSKGFEFPNPSYDYRAFEVTLEHPYAVDFSYREFRAQPRFEVPLQKGKFYIRNYTGSIVETKDILSLRFYENYVVDDIGPRRLTLGECAQVKGLPAHLFERRPKNYGMYKKLSLASNVYVVRKIAENIKNILENNEGNINPLDWPAEAAGKEKRSQDKKKKSPEYVQLSLFDEKFNKSQNRILNMHIDRLKGLKNLEITFEKNLTAIMGVNGVGKSTILHALACTFAPDNDREDYKFNFFFTPNPDATWQDSKFFITCFDDSMSREFIREYKKNADRWSPRYAQRPKRDVFYMGIDTGLPEIEKERQTTYIDYYTNILMDKLSDRVITKASEILEKDYRSLTYHKTKKKALLGVNTNAGITYSSLSMGAGEQRVLKILRLVMEAKPYSMILIDEIDLLLHASALKRLIKTLSEIAVRKSLQIIFTTHSLTMKDLKDYVDIRYLYQTKEKTMVYDTITPDIVFDLNKEISQPISIYVEDDVSECAVSRIANDLGMLRYVSIKHIGSAQNAFTLAAGLVLEGASLENVLIVTDGDVYRTKEEKIAQLKKRLSGTESDHDEKISEALSMLTQFELPERIAPEKFIHDMLTSFESKDEIINCANMIQTVTDEHDWLNRIIERMNQDRKITLYQVFERISKHESWRAYTKNIREWLMEKQNKLHLN